MGAKYVPPYDRKEKHLPECNWCGPGTNVTRRIKEGVQPMSALDKACMQHDMDTESRGPKRAGTDSAKIRASDARLARQAKKIALDRRTSKRQRALAWVVYRAMKINKWRKSRGGDLDV